MDYISLYSLDIENHLVKNLGELNIRSYKDWILFKGNDSITLIEKNLSKVKISKEECKKIINSITNFENKHNCFEKNDEENLSDEKNPQNLDFIPLLKNKHPSFKKKHIKALNKLIMSKGITQFISVKENLYSIFWFFKQYEFDNEKISKENCKDNDYFKKRI